MSHNTKVPESGCTTSMTLSKKDLALWLYYSNQNEKIEHPQNGISLNCQHFATRIQPESNIRVASYHGSKYETDYTNDKIHSICSFLFL